MKYIITDPEIRLAEHQTKAIDFIISRKESLINYETGTGKTFICIESIFRLIEAGKLEKALIVCTKSSVLSFESDIKKTNYPIKNLVIIRSNKDLESISNKNKAIFIIQYETLINTKLINLTRAFKDFKSGLFIDEVHKVKTIGKKKESQTAKCLNYLKSAFVYLVGLTATTVTSELEDGYRVISFIKPGVLGGIKWFHENFCIYKEGTRYLKKYRKYVTYPKLVGYKNLDRFLKYTKDVMIQYFPKLDYRFHVLAKSMKEGSKRALKYDELAMQTHGRNNNKHSSIMPKLQRLIDKSNTKKFLLQQLIEKCREDGLIIYSRTRKADMLEYIKNIVEEAGMEARVISGSTSKEERQEIIDWGFEGSPKNKCVIGTQAMGQSLNLHWTHNLCYFEIPMGPGQFSQVKGRIGRMFSKWKHYDFWFLLVKNTIDEYWYLKMTANKEMLGATADNQFVPNSKLNEYNERKLKKERDLKVWRKNLQAEEAITNLRKIRRKK